MVKDRERRFPQQFAAEAPQSREDYLVKLNHSQGLSAEILDCSKTGWFSGNWNVMSMQVRLKLYW